MTGGVMSGAECAGRGLKPEGGHFVMQCDV